MNEAARGYQIGFKIARHCASQESRYRRVMGSERGASMSFLRGIAAAGCLLWSTAAFAQGSNVPEPAATPRVVVVATPGARAPNLRRPVKRQLEPRLANFAELVPLRRYRRAAAAAGIRPRALAEVTTATTVGATLELTHVVSVRSIREPESGGRRRRNVFYAEVSVISVAESAVTFTERYRLAGRRVTPAVLDSMAQAIGGELRLPPPPPVEPVAVAPPPPPPAPEPVTKPVDVAPPAASSPPATPAVHVRGQHIEFTVAAGPSFLQRDGSVSAENLDDAITYSGPMIGGHVELGLFLMDPEFVPFDFVAGLGVHGRSLVFPGVSTEFDPTDRERTTSSLVSSAEGGLAARLDLPDSLGDPELMLVAGYSYWDFPLDEGAFPGLNYQGPYGQLRLTFPVLSDLTVHLEGGAIFPLDTGGGGGDIGELDQGLGWTGELGAKLRFELFDVRLVGVFRQVSASYQGQSNLRLDLAPVDSELTDADLSDRYFGASLLIGFSL